MRRFILLSFGFLGLAFYEMSDGADFDPIIARDAAVFARSGIIVENRQANILTAETQQGIDAPTVTRLSLNLTSLSDVLEAKEPLRVDVTPAIASGVDTSGVAPVTFETNAENQVVLPSIIFPGRSSQASSDAVTRPRDLRYVSASAVNMRGGPGTGFDVVTKLERDTQVEILQDDGTGWVKLRPAEGGPEGWIADFLLAGR